MLHRRLFNGIAIFCLVLHVPKLCYSQAPAISYTNPNTYIVNTPITPLTPKNSGGVVPPDTYAMVKLIAGQTGITGATGGGLGQSLFIRPLSICTNALGNIFVNDPANKGIREILPSKQNQVYFRSQGVPTNAGPTALNNFDNPTGIASDAVDNVYIADTYNNLIRKVGPDLIISNLAGDRSAAMVDGTGTAAKFYNPTEMTIDAAGNLYVVDGGTSNNWIRKITPAGVVTTLFKLNNLGSIGGIVRDKAGNFFVTKPTDHRIEKISAAGVVTVFAGTGIESSIDGPANIATFDTPGGIAMDGEENLYVVSSLDNLVRKITPAGMITTLAGQITAGAADGVGIAASFRAPTGIAIAPDGNAYIADNGNYTVRRMSLNGYEIDKVLPPGLSFDNTTGVITGTPTSVFPPTDYKITAHNYYGSITTTVTIQVVFSGVLTFSPISDKTTCSADFSPPASSLKPITYSSSNNAVAVIVNNKVHIVGPGTVNIIANDGNATLTQTFRVTTVATPTISINASKNPACVGDQVTFTAEASNAGNNPAYVWHVNGNAINAATSSLTQVFNDGDVVDCAVTPSSECSTPVTSAAIKMVVEAIPTVKFTSTAIPVKPGQKVALSPVYTGNIVSYSWSPATSLDDAGGPNPVASPTGNTVYTITVNTVAGCQASAEVSVKIIADISVNNSFSPNNDGVNDTWNIPDLAYFPGCTVKVYTRYGNMVYNSVSYTKPWDGTFNGSNLPAGTYYYIIDPKNNTHVLSGMVNIIR